MNKPPVTVLLHDAAYVETLAQQDYPLVELVTWADEDWHEQAAELADAKGWSHCRVSGPADALDATDGPFIIEWNVYQASANALQALVDAADQHPDAEGSLTGNWDPAILWRRDEFTATTGRTGLVEAPGVAYANGGQLGQPNAGIYRRVRSRPGGDADFADRLTPKNHPDAE